VGYWWELALSAGAPYGQLHVREIERGRDRSLGEKEGKKVGKEGWGLEWVTAYRSSTYSTMFHDGVLPECLLKYAELLN
jgi:hypothetical protein